MDIFEFASVTYCTNLPRGEYPSDSEAQDVALQIAEIFQSRLRESPFAEDLIVVRAEFEIGCVLTTLTFGATVAALYKFIKEYPKFRPGLMLLLKDLNGIYVRFNRSSKEGSTYLMRDDIPEKNELEAIAEESKSGIKKPAQVKEGVARRSDRSAK